jgi:hypothetical protein
MALAHAVEPRGGADYAVTPSGGAARSRNEDVSQPVVRERGSGRYAGHDRVRILHGGLRAWRERGGALERQERRYPATTFSGVLRPEMIASKDEVLAAIERSGVCTINALPANLYEGVDRTQTRAARRRGEDMGSAYQKRDLLEDGCIGGGRARCSSSPPAPGRSLPWKTSEGLAPPFTKKPGVPESGQHARASRPGSVPRSERRGFLREPDRTPYRVRRRGGAEIS